MESGRFCFCSCLQTPFPDKMTPLPESYSFFTIPFFCFSAILTCRDISFLPAEKGRAPHAAL